MSRTYAKIYVSVWADEDFKSLSTAAQSLYFRLLTDAKLSMCGVVDWRPNRISKSARDTTAASIRKAGDELERQSFIVIDEDTEEALVRSFIRHDGVLKSPNLVKAMLADWLMIASRPLQETVWHEVQKAKAADPQMKGLDQLPEWFQISSGNPSGNPSDLVPNEFPEGSPILQPATDNQQPSTVLARATRTPTKRGTRLPDDWMPSQELITQMRTECPNTDLKAEHLKFTDHWRAKTGRDATKLDWPATWRNWIRNARPNANGVKPRNQQETEAWLTRAMERAIAADSADEIKEIEA